MLIMPRGMSTRPAARRLAVSAPLSNGSVPIRSGAAFVRTQTGGQREAATPAQHLGGMAWYSRPNNKLTTNVRKNMAVRLLAPSMK